jgi:hypothetical protein
MFSKSSAGRAPWMRLCRLRAAKSAWKYLPLRRCWTATPATVTGLIEKKQADELPLNGRDWSELTAFVPGAIDTGGSNQRSVRFAGTRPRRQQLYL